MVLVSGSNMKKLNLIISSIVVFALLSFANPQKRISKLISKIWKDKEVSLQRVDLDKPINKISRLNTLYTEGKLIGYACYTSANGCRIGGCSAPTDQVDDSYESFDYIVIYDVDMKILKVDIANYGGEYGYEICRAKWLKQFKGKSKGFVLNESIDGISGATVSASHLIDNINQLGSSMLELKNSKAL